MSADVSANAGKTLYLSVSIKHHDEMCEVCWKTGLVTLTTKIISDDGVTDREPRTYCRLCRKDGDRA